MELFLFILIAVGVTLIYDARKITAKYFSNQDQNTVTLILKVIGFLVSVICAIIICALKARS